MKVSAVLLAAGSSRRAGGDVPKQFAELYGRPMLLYSIEMLLGLEAVGEAVVVIPPGAQALAERLVAPYGGRKPIKVAEGGPQRQHSSRVGVMLTDPGADIVLIHDAARPLASAALTERVIEAASRSGGAVPVLPVIDTVIEVGERGTVARVLERDKLAACQTPQGFRAELIRQAHTEAHARGMEGFTDDGSLVLRLAGSVIETVPGERWNLKVTYAEDFIVAEALLKSLRRSKAG